ncbi:MAG: GxxExxY protein [Candidatus Cloacimonadaceae bacterium]|nr:GxxExxY protein [Candidatus Cloacimonadaceae bacterium]
MKLTDSELNALSGKIIGACIEVHRHLRPGLLESVYMECLCCELDHRELSFEREVIIPITYKELSIISRLRADLIVENSVILELKSVNNILPIYEAQLMSYLKLTNKQLGLLINFNVPLLKDGITRLRCMNNMKDPAQHT